MILRGDCIKVMKAMKPNSVDAIVTDPPYNLHFMGKDWDTDLLHEKWLTEAYQVLKPGGSMLAMGGTRTFHRLACAIEDSGFIVKDTLMWLYGSGFPKAQDLGKMIGKRGGDGEYWDGFKVGGIKPAYEPIIWAVKPPEGSYIDNVLKWGVGAVNVEECKVGVDNIKTCAKKEMHGCGSTQKMREQGFRPYRIDNRECPESSHKGRFPANIILDEEVGGMLDEQINGDKGDVSRFFYCAKASRSERNRGLEDSKNIHPTCKPIKLFEHLIKLVTREGQIILDPFLGSGTTAISARNTGRKCVGIEREEEYLTITQKRIEHWKGQLK